MKSFELAGGIRSRNFLNCNHVRLQSLLIDNLFLSLSGEQHEKVIQFIFAGVALMNHYADRYRQAAVFFVPEICTNSTEHFRLFS